MHDTGWIYLGSIGEQLCQELHALFYCFKGSYRGISVSSHRLVNSSKWPSPKQFSSALTALFNLWKGCQDSSHYSSLWYILTLSVSSSPSTRYVSSPELHCQSNPADTNISMQYESSKYDCLFEHTHPVGWTLAFHGHGQWASKQKWIHFRHRPL